MDPCHWHKVAAISGMAALALGTYGAHVFKPKNPADKEVWHTASTYHLVHTVALLAAPMTKHPNIFGGLLKNLERWKKNRFRYYFLKEIKGGNKLMMRKKVT